MVVVYLKTKLFRCCWGKYFDSPLYFDKLSPSEISMGHSTNGEIFENNASPFALSLSTGNA